MNHNIGGQIKSLREARGLTQAELASLISTRQNAISRLEQSGCNSYTLTTLARVATALGARLQIDIIDCNTSL